MRNTQGSGQILRSKKRPRRTIRSGRGSRTNSNTSRQIPARVIDAGYDTRACTHKSRRLIVMAVTKCLILSAEGERVHSSVEVGVILCRLHRAAWAARASTSTYAKEFVSWQ